MGGITLGELLPEAVGGVGLLAMVAYAVLAGADFGGGIWDLAAHGERAAEQRRAIAQAMGPVWEANHVWLIFVIVLLFSCFPAAYAALSVAFFVPFHLVLVGITMRGAAFAFRAHGRDVAGMHGYHFSWGHVFGIASVITPLLLGACLGAVSDGQIHVQLGGSAASPAQPPVRVTMDSPTPWLALLPLAMGLLALATCAYLAAVYLTLETAGEVREDFRKRALWIWLIAGLLSLATLLLTYSEAPRLWEGLTSARAGWAVLGGVLLAPASAAAMWRRRFGWARLLAVGQAALLLLGWALAQWPYVIYPDLTLRAAAAPAATLSAVLWTVPFGMAALLPSLWLLFAVFKGRNPAVQRVAQTAQTDALPRQA